MKRPTKPAKFVIRAKKNRTAPSSAPRIAKKQLVNGPALNAAAPSSQRPDSKLSIVMSMLRSTKGATIDALSKATGWQAHSVRGAMSGAIKKKRGLAVTSEKVDGVRTYRISD